MERISIDKLQITDPGWINFVSNHPDATIFHHPAWSRLLADCYNYDPFLIAQCDGAQRVIGGIVLMERRSLALGIQIVSLPVSDFCPPLAGNGDTLNKLIGALQELRWVNKCSQIEIHWPLEEVAGVFKGEPTIMHITNLDSDYEKLFKGFRKGVKSSIHQAEKGGVTTRIGTSWEDLEEFYAIHSETRRRIGRPVQPYRFFRLLWERLIDKDLGFVVSAYKDSQLLASSIFLYWNAVLIYKFSASKPEFWGLRPNNLILWHAIRWGCENGYRIFNWGKTDPENEGLRTFKCGWASEEKLMHYSILADKPPKPSKLRGVRPLLTKCIQHSPSWACRVIGELFYKYVT